MTLGPGLLSPSESTRNNWKLHNILTLNTFPASYWVKKSPEFNPTKIQAALDHWNEYLVILKVIGWNDIQRKMSAPQVVEHTNFWNQMFQIFLAIFGDLNVPLALIPKENWSSCTLAMFLIKKCQLLWHTTVTLVLALVTLGGMTLIGSFILAKAVDIAGIIMHNIKQAWPMNTRL
jgi:hypothetical protein